MTRLITEWIKDIDDTVNTWNSTLEKITGMDLSALAAKAADMSEMEIKKYCDSIRVAVVPVTSGEGIIGTFSESVASIVRAAGFQAFVTDETDVAGVYEAHKKGAGMIVSADDSRYIALNIENGGIGENDIATARGYIEALEGMNRQKTGEDLADKEVLLLGYGRVGKQMRRYLQEKGARVTVYDSSEERQHEADADSVAWVNTAEVIKNFRLIIDATNTGPWITPDMLREDALFSSPGIPFSLDKKTCEFFEGQYVHDALEIGTAVMIALAAKGKNDE